MDVLAIINELEEELAASRAGLFKKKLDEDKLFRLVEDLKNGLPKAIEEASYLTAQRDKMLADAKAQAAKIVQSAEAKAAELLAENNIVRQAEEGAKKMTEIATKRSEQLLETTKNNVDKILKAVEDYLSEHISIVHDSREELSSTLVQLKNNLRKD